MVKKTNPDLTERQYRTLRRLMLLWFSVIMRRKHKIFLNLLLLLSLVFNCIFYFNRKNPEINIIEKQIDFDVALNLSNYESISNRDHTLKKRFDKLHARYLDDKSSPDSSHYNKNKTVSSDWLAHCKMELKRIVSIKSRVRVLEKMLNTVYPNKEEEIYSVIQKTRTDEILADMSNYYARFVSSGDYNYIVKTFD